MTSDEPIDLNNIREAILAARNESLPHAPTISVNNKGLIVERSHDQDPEVLSKLPPQRFAYENLTFKIHATQTTGLLQAMYRDNHCHATISKGAP